MGEWTLFSNHGHVLVCLANNHQARLRDVAAEVGITERAVQNILRELQDSGMVQVSKHGRCNHYQINTRKSLRHPLESHCTVGKLLQLLKSGGIDDASLDKSNPEAATERASRTRNTLADTKQKTTEPVAKPKSTVDPANPKTAEPVASASPKTREAVATPKTTEPIAKPKATEAAVKPAQQVVKPSESVEPAVENLKPAKETRKDAKKTIPAKDQQGSLF